MMTPRGNLKQLFLGQVVDLHAHQAQGGHADGEVPVAGVRRGDHHVFFQVGRQVVPRFPANEPEVEFCNQPDHERS
jgi:hypothetical protein